MSTGRGHVGTDDAVLRIERICWGGEARLRLNRWTSWRDAQLTLSGVANMNAGRPVPFGHTSESDMLKPRKTKKVLFSEWDPPHDHPTSTKICLQRYI